MAQRVSVASLRALNATKTPATFCCARCLAHRSVARTNLRNRIAAFQAVRTGRQPVSTITGIKSYSDNNVPYTPQIQPTTSINKPLEIQPAFQELHNALERLKTDAANYVGISRLGLAMRSLEGQQGTTRVAVLALNGDVTLVRRLVRLLLADPLGSEQSWERSLADDDESSSLLLKYGDTADRLWQSSSKVRTLIIPSETLRKHNIEILVSSLQLETTPSEFGPSGEAHDAILVPGFEAQSTSTGRSSHMTYPVHKSLLVGEGLQDLVSYGRFISHSSGASLPQELVQIAIESSAISGGPAEAGEATILDVTAGEHALASIRQSISNAVAWERGWCKAGIPPLSSWFQNGLRSEKRELKPVVMKLIESVLSDIKTSVRDSTEAADEMIRTQTVPQNVRRDLMKATMSWSEDAHKELQNQLDLAFASKNWAKLKWYKLFWRSDDVTMLLSEIIERRWLVNAEKSGVYLAGRIEGAGLVSADVEGKLLNTPSPSPEDTIPSPLIQATIPQDATGKHPYPMHVSLTRTALLSRTVPSLQALSEKLVLQTGSATALTTALTAMAYLGFNNASMFEAGAVFAFGIVISLKRLQSKWEGAREYWQGEVREEGRVALKQTEDGIKDIIEKGGVAIPDSIGVADRATALAAVQRVEDALHRLK